MKTNIVKSCHIKDLTMPVTTPELNSQIFKIKASNNVKRKYKHVSKALSLKLMYEILCLAEFEPEGR